MYWKEIVEFSFYFVETFALPFAILVFLFERRKERLAEEEELNQRLSDEYIGFLKLVLENADLQLLHRRAPLRELSEEQQERRFALFGILVSIFERAYILVGGTHEPANSPALVFLGRLHARMVSSPRIPKSITGTPTRRRSGVSWPYRKHRKGIFWVAGRRAIAQL
jgi:hypothetical protein